MSTLCSAMKTRWTETSVDSEDASASQISASVDELCAMFPSHSSSQASSFIKTLCAFILVELCSVFFSVGANKTGYLAYLTLVLDLRDF